jgi:HNH endonuclease
MAGENAAKRGRLFDLYVREPGHQDLTQGRLFWCPLCRRPFGREATAGDNPRLTLAHIISASLGGTWTTLACADCNSGHGHQIEAHLLASHRFTDWAARCGTIKVRMGEGGKVRAESRRDQKANQLSFNVTTPMVNPSVRLHKEQLTAMVQNPSVGQELKVTFPWFRPGWCWAAACQSAYLLMFKYFGYDFARNLRYNLLRDQVFRSGGTGRIRNVLILPSEVADQFLEGRQAAVVFVREPMRAILAVLRFKSPGGLDQVLAVGMPGPDEPPLTAMSLTDALYSPVSDDPAPMSSQEGSFWLAWHHWLRSEGLVQSTARYYAHVPVLQRQSVNQGGCVATMANEPVSGGQRGADVRGTSWRPDQ